MIDEIIGALREIRGATSESPVHPPIHAEPLYLPERWGSREVADQSEFVVVGEEPGREEILERGPEEHIKTAGFEAIAWYRSYHYGRDAWGIYIKEEGLHFVGHQVMQGEDPLDSPYRVQLAYKLIHTHEYFHFLTDLAATFLELEKRQPVYIPYDKASPPWHPRCTLEEALANAYAYKSAYPKGCKQRVRRFMKNQPDGYAEFDRYTELWDFTKGLRELGKSLDGVSWPTTRELIFDWQQGMASPWEVPVYIVRARAFKVLQLIQNIQDMRPGPKWISDLGRLSPELQRRVEKTKDLIRASVRHPSLDFKLLKNCDAVFRCRVSQGYRMTLRQENSHWQLLRVGKHEDIDRKPL